MKKFVISIFILGTLVVYSAGIRHEQPKISAPSSLATNSSPTTSSSGTPPANNNSGSNTTSGASSAQVLAAIRTAPTPAAWPMHTMATCR